MDAYEKLAELLKRIEAANEKEKKEMLSIIANKLEGKKMEAIKLFDANNITETKMTMSFELITPEIAKEMLQHNKANRSLARGTVEAYKNDMLSGNWDSQTGTAISFDENGILRDGQHRLAAIVASGMPVMMWVCRGTKADAVYDNNRPRRSRDFIAVMLPDIEPIYKKSIPVAVIDILVRGKWDRGSKVTPRERANYINTHKKLLDGYFLNVSLGATRKVTITTVHTALFLAYQNGVKIEKINEFYEILQSGMSANPEAFPIIAYRNYLLAYNGGLAPTKENVSRCQYALKKFLSKSCAKITKQPNDIIWGFVKEDENEKDLL